MSMITDHQPEGEHHPDDQVLTVGEVAARCDVTSSTVVRWASDGRLPHSRTLGGPKGPGHRRFREADVEQILAEQAMRS
jgi:excisionase family DNA binding protein